jgi:acetyl-CoA synthetase
VAKADPEVGQAIVAFVTLKGGLVGDDPVAAELREHVAKVIGKIARPHSIIFTDDLPKTRSGKIMRRLLRDVAEGRQLGDVTTLANAEIVEAIRDLSATAAPEE